MDDRNWRQQNARAVLWIANTPKLAFYEISSVKSAETAKQILGEAFDGVLLTDRVSNYNFQPWKKRQFCWATATDTSPDRSRAGAFKRHRDMGDGRNRPGI
ncbi:MAG: transposase [Vulcanimicrobiota bacterium]